MAIGDKVYINNLQKGPIPISSKSKLLKHNINKLKLGYQINKNKKMLKHRGTLIMLSAIMVGEDAILATEETSKKDRDFKKGKLSQQKSILIVELSNGKQMGVEEPPFKQMY